MGSFFSNDVVVIANHRICQDALGTCDPECLDEDDYLCQCKVLFECASNLTRIDLATV